MPTTKLNVNWNYVYLLIKWLVAISPAVDYNSLVLNEYFSTVLSLETLDTGGLNSVGDLRDVASYKGSI